MSNKCKITNNKDFADETAVMSYQTEQIGVRIRQRRKELKLTQKNIADYLQITPSSITQWELGISAPSGKNLINLGKVLDCDPEWILSGENRDLSIANVSHVEGQINYRNSFPVISFVQAGVWTEAVEDHKVSEYYETTERTSGNCFWLRVKGDSMTAPFGLSFPEGTMILVDTEREYQSGSYVIAKLIDVNEATFKKLVIDAGVKLLKPLNPAYPTLPINGNCRIVGVVVDAKLKLF